MAVPRSGNNRSTPAAQAQHRESREDSEKGKLKRGERRQGTSRPKLRAAETGRGADAPPSPRGHDMSKTPTRELRRQAAESGIVLSGSPRSGSPRPESPRSPDPGAQQQKGVKRRAIDAAPGAETLQKKKSRTEAEAGQSAAPPAQQSDAAGTARGSAGMKSLFRKEKKPSSEELRSDPDETGDAQAGQGGRKARLPRTGSFLFSRGAIDTTLLDSTSEDLPGNAQPMPACSEGRETGE